MSQFITVLTVATILCLCVIVAAFRWMKTVTIRIPGRAIQERIDKKIPLAVEKAGCKFRLIKATTTLNAGNRIAIEVSGTLAVGPVEAPISASLSAGLRYDEARFFLSDFQVSTCQVEPVSLSKIGVSPDSSWSWVGALQSAANILNLEEKVGKATEEHRLGLGNYFSQHGGPLLAKALEHYPVYTIEGRQGLHRVARMTLVSVHTEHEILAVTLRLPGA
ncbi:MULTISPECIES: DUF1439 domain-containing protein [Asaia]|uniref:Uncharacterized protein n=1 Tax=Asaia spathodeae TaxID=657016 RepID=A0ABX2P8K3_9PROT|nr:DUF1439 domain-containing protein [Asaia spathodeae]